MPEHGARRTEQDGILPEVPVLTVEELRIQIEHYATVSDAPTGLAHDVVGLCLVRLARDHGVAEANTAIEDFDLEVKGWAKREEEGA